MADSEPRSENNGGDIMINAPEFLGAEQNIFDQEPFSNLVTKTSKATGLSEEVLRGCLTEVVDAVRKIKYGHAGRMSEVDARELPGDQVDAVSDIAAGAMHQHILSASKEDFIGPTHDMVTALNEYPYWLTYVGHISSYFTRSGERRRNPSKIPDESPTYVSFAFHKLEREGRIREKRGRPLPEGAGRELLQGVRGDLPRNWVLRRSGRTEGKQ